MHFSVLKDKHKISTGQKETQSSVNDTWQNIRTFPDYLYLNVIKGQNNILYSKSQVNYSSNSFTNKMSLVVWGRVAPSSICTEAVRSNPEFKCVSPIGSIEVSIVPARPLGTEPRYVAVVKSVAPHSRLLNIVCWKLRLSFTYDNQGPFCLYKKKRRYLLLLCNPPSVQYHVL